MNFRHFLSILCFSLHLQASAQMGLPPSDEEDDDGLLTPEYMNFLTDSGRLEQNDRVGFWKEYQFSAFMTNRRRAVQYDSLVHYDSVRRYLTFYKHEGEYQNGRKEGEWKTYICYKKRLPLKWRYESTVIYVAGKRQGWEQVFSKTGEFVGRNYYRNDLRDSLSSFYYSAEILSSTTQYRNGKLHGKSVMYKSTGEVLFEIVYKEDKRVGAVFYSGDGRPPHITGQHDTYHYNGKLKSSSNYSSQGDLEGPHMTFYPDGNPEKEMNFKNGALDGTFKAYYDNRQLKQEWVYKDGKLWEVVQSNTKKGKSLSPGTLKDGNGTVLTYNDTGKLLSTVSYKNGIQDRSDTDD
jgi:antitoxin component YwqK of YwqJK toxin-antitoxin module